MPQESKLAQLITQQISVENGYVKCLSDLREKVGVAAATVDVFPVCAKFLIIPGSIAKSNAIPVIAATMFMMSPYSVFLKMAGSL